MVTKMKGIALGVVTADCVPIILYDVKNQIIGCVHAGWKGAYLGIIKNTINKIKKMNSNNLIYACLGPCIGHKSYEVDLVFFKKFINLSNKNKKYFTHKNNNKKLFNLRKFVTDEILEDSFDLIISVVDNVKQGCKFIFKKWFLKCCQ